MDIVGIPEPGVRLSIMVGVIFVLAVLAVLIIFKIGEEDKKRGIE